MHPKLHSRRTLALVLATLVAAGSAFAGPPPWAGGGKHGGGEESHKGKEHGGGKHADKGPKQGAFFDSRNRDSVHHYYASAKSCPPGLAKKNNGCMPPGQAKKQWNVGQPLPSTVVVYPVPKQIIVTLPPVPVGHKYVQVAGDILLVAAGSMMVVDGINGLMR
ncbi:DUF1236 domain-containing protein [Ramlibacter sp. XY19]|uniref:DUF1236 domain-containing protein n=1 Tax=Ramlibacter paludis TaxID=2908000 RepID=UPI0023DA423E|nr:DUF1236 domain-containing protein [Ramlibacter paludis]MCG2594458.1 DUF1236 domain-containing protein [Ramlibacter paludis]